MFSKEKNTLLNILFCSMILWLLKKMKKTSEDCCINRTLNKVPLGNLWRFNLYKLNTCVVARIWKQRGATQEISWLVKKWCFLNDCSQENTVFCYESFQCKKLAGCGEEMMFMTVNLTQKTTTCIGSQLGVNFLNHKPVNVLSEQMNSISEMFQHFLEGL